MFVRARTEGLQTREWPGRRPLRDSASGALRARRDRPRHRQLVRPQAPSPDAGRRRGARCGARLQQLLLRSDGGEPRHREHRSLVRRGHRTRSQLGQPAGPDAGQRPGDAQQPALLGRGRSRHADDDGVRDRRTDPVGDNSAGTPCATSTLDVKATDVDVPKLFSWLGIRPDIKAHARVEIHAGEGGVGLPPARRTRDRSELRVRDLRRLREGRDADPAQGAAAQEETAGLLTAAGPAPSRTRPGYRRRSPRSRATRRSLSPEQHARTGVVILVSKSDAAPSKTRQRSTRSATRRRPISSSATQVRAAQATTAPRRGRDWPSSTASRRATDRPTAPASARRAADRHGVHRRPAAGNLSGPYYINDDSDCTVGVTAKVDFGVRPTPANGDPRKKPNQGGFCAESASGLGAQHERDASRRGPGRCRFP